MDLSSILPLLLGGTNPQMASILSAMNGTKTGEGGSGMNEMLASILASQNKDKNQDTKASSDNLAPLASMLGAKGGPNAQTELLMNLMSSMNNKKPSRAHGLSVIQRIAPNDILGILLKYYNRFPPKSAR